MRLSTQLNAGALRAPRGFQQLSTLKLISSGLFFSLPFRGVPVFSGMGLTLMRNIERMAMEEAGRLGFSETHLPAIVDEALLSDGEDVGETFASKLIKVSIRTGSFQLLATPEMFLVRQASRAVLSYRSLPIRVCYNADFFRDMPTTRSFVTCRQFRVFGMLSMEKDRAGIQRAQDTTGEFEKIFFSRLGLPYRVEAEANGFETFLELGKGMTGLEHDELSVSMGYHYAREKSIPCRYRTENNRNRALQVWTYGISLNRIFLAVLDSARDELGFALPPHLRPFDVAVVPSRSTDEELAWSTYQQLLARRVRPFMDDRSKSSRSERRAFSQYVGCPYTAVVESGGVLWYKRGSAKPVPAPDLVAGM
jgi:prolyl-tRNA synthetase